MKLSLIALIFFCLQFNANGAVILQYHHVNDSTPASTSISPSQFAAHLKYLSDNNFTVVPLSHLVNAIKKQTPLKDKLVAITFDDAYSDILSHAKPLLDQYSYPYTIFINPEIVDRKSTSYLSWLQLKSLADEGVIIANHGLTHDSIARIPNKLLEADWLEIQTSRLLKSEALIKQHTGQSWHYFAYPYGEYTPAIQHWIKQNGFVAFSQQSGAVGLSNDLTIIPRFPVSQPYDKLSSLRDKLNSLPLNIELYDVNAETVFNNQTLKSVTFGVEVDDFKPSQLNCYISGLGRQKIAWQGEQAFSITFNGELPIGRVRCNCTAPSISEPGRYYWYSKPWFILKEDATWYPL